MFCVTGFADMSVLVCLSCQRLTAVIPRIYICVLTDRRNAREMTH